MSDQNSSHAGLMWGIFCGVAGGVPKYLVQINSSVSERLIEAVSIAFVCGIAGAMGKHIYDMAKPYVISFFKKLLKR
jgi:hypothetical protein